MCTKTFYAVITVYAIVLICYVLKHAKFSLTKLLIRSGEVLCVAVLDMETPCPSDALSARFSVRGNVLTTFLFIVSKVWIVILSLDQIGFRT